MKFNYILTLPLLLTETTANLRSSTAIEDGRRGKEIKKRILYDGGELSDDDKQALLAKHNELRSSVAMGNTCGQPAAMNMKALTWNDTIADGAKAWADGCEFEHDNSGYGENLYAAGSSTDNLDSIEKLESGIQAWFNEQEDFNYNRNRCTNGKVCGHYTQVVWANSAQLGCGYALCSNNIFSFEYELMLVCRYDPPGNYVGADPYEEACDDADIASNCPSGFTANSSTGLCEEESSVGKRTVRNLDEEQQRKRPSRGQRLAKLLQKLSLY